LLGRVLQLKKYGLEHPTQSSAEQ